MFEIRGKKAQSNFQDLHGIQVWEVYVKHQTAFSTVYEILNSLSPTHITLMSLTKCHKFTPLFC